LKQDGEAVKAGENLFTLEGEKATEEIECLDAGILRIPPNAPKPGAKVAVGTVIGYLVREGESVGWAEPSRPTDEQHERLTLASPQRKQDVTLTSPQRKQDVTLTSPQRKQGDALVGLEDLAHPPAQARSTRTKAASPRARRAAREVGIDWTKLAGSG